MITIKIQGGLGNQMFEYALAYKIHNDFKKEVLLDLRFFNSENNNYADKRTYELDAFNISDFRCIYTDEDFIKFYKKPGMLRRIQNRILPHSNKTYYYKENKLGFDESVFGISDSCYLEGYFQSFLYFEGIEEEIKSQFTLKKQLSSESLDVLSEINSCANSISIHVRRGDYLTSFSNIYFLLNAEYFIKSVNCIKSKTNLTGYKVFVFSDDIEWCKRELFIDGDVFFIDSKHRKAPEDLHLMSMCRYNIIANSTFSWWAAWLNVQKNKIVIAPKKWYKNQSESLISHLYPSSWITQ